MILNITKYAIKKSIGLHQRDNFSPSGQCLLATAAQIQFGRGANVICGFQFITINDHVYGIPPEGRTMVHDFIYGRYEKLKPCELELMP